MRISIFAAMLALLLAMGFPGVSLAGSLLGDSDGDGIDDVLDNCRDVSNTSQVDVDADGCGNHCDGDFDQNAATGSSDFNNLRTCFGQSVPGSGQPSDPTCAEADMDGNGTVGSSDFNLFRNAFGNPPGPSLSPIRNPLACP